MRFALIVTTLAGIATIANAQEQPNPGTYYIVNRVRSPAGNKLAATFQVGQSNVIVTPLNNSVVQRVSFLFSISFRDVFEPPHLQWMITLGEQFILPVTNQNVAATGEGNDVVIRPKDGFVWTIRNVTNNYYT